MDNRPRKYETEYKTLGPRNKYDSFAERVLEVHCQRTRYNWSIRDAIALDAEQTVFQEVNDRDKTIEQLRYQLAKERKNNRYYRELAGGKAAK